jgi:hypothetical protein
MDIMLCGTLWKLKIVLYDRHLPETVNQLLLPVRGEERVGFEPTVPEGTADFESTAFDLSATSPDIWCAQEDSNLRPTVPQTVALSN